MSVRQTSGDNPERDESLKETYESLENSIDAIQRRLKFMVDNLFYHTVPDAEKENKSDIENKGNSQRSVSTHENPSDSKPDEKRDDIIGSDEKSKLCDSLKKLMKPDEILNGNKCSKIEEFIKELIEGLNEANARDEDDIKETDGNLDCVLGMLFYTYALHANLEVIKRFYKKFNDKLDSEEQLNLIQLLSVFYIMELFKGSRMSDSNGGMTGVHEEGFYIIEDYIRKYRIKYAPFYDKFTDDSLKNKNIFIMILKDESLNEILMLESFLLLFEHLENVPDISSVYSEENPDLVLRSCFDKVLLKFIKNGDERVINKLIEKTSLQVPFNDILRICKIEKGFLDDDLFDRSLTVLGRCIEDFPDIYSEKNFNSELDNAKIKLRSWCDGMLLTCIKENHQKYIVDFVKRIQSKLSMSDLLRICRPGFEKDFRFGKEQKKIICNLLCGLEVVRKPSKKKAGYNNKKNKKKRSAPKSEEQKKREEQFKDFINQFKGVEKPKDSEEASFRLSQEEKISEDTKVSQENEDDNVSNARETLMELVDDSAGYPGFKLKNKLDKLDKLILPLSKSKKNRSNPDNDEQRLPSGSERRYVNTFKKTLKQFVTHKKSSRNTGNQHKNVSEDDGFDFLKACAQIHTLCQVVQEWVTYSKKIVDRTDPNIGIRALSDDEKRRCKRYVYWQYIQAMQIKDFIKKTWESSLADKMSESLLLKSPNARVQKVVTDILSDTYVLSKDMTVKVSSIDSNCRALLQAASQIRFNITVNKKHSYERSVFGDLCKAVFLDGANNIDETLEQLTGEKKKYRYLSPHDRLALCFLETTPAPVPLFGALKTELSAGDEKWLEFELQEPNPFPQVSSASHAFLTALDSKEDSPYFSVSMRQESDAEKGVFIKESALLAKVLTELLPVDSDPTIYLTGKVPALLLAESEGIWPSGREGASRRLERYFRHLGGDFDFLTTSTPDAWQGLIKTRLRVHLDKLCDWFLWRKTIKFIPWSSSRDSIEEKILEIPLDVVQIQPEIQRENDESCELKSDDDDLIRRYKEKGSCVSTLDSLVLRVNDRKTGRCELISGDFDRLKMQFQNRYLAIHQLEQFEGNIAKFKDKNLSVEDVDATGLKLLKFLDALVGLNDLVGLKDYFSVEPKSLLVIHRHREDLNRLILDINDSRKESFHRKLFARPATYVQNYLKLLQTVGLLDGFFQLDFEKIVKNKGGVAKISEKNIFWYNHNIENAIKILSLSGRNYSENIYTAIALERFFRQSPEFSCANEFLEKVCSLSNYNKGDIFQYVNAARKNFNRKKEALLQKDLLTDPREIKVQADASEKSLIAAWSEHHRLPELKQEGASANPFILALAKNKRLWLSELQAQISKNISGYKRLSDISKVRLSFSPQRGDSFGVFVKTFSKDFENTLTVFHVVHDKKHYTFSGVFENRVDRESPEIELRVFATPKTVDFLSTIAKNDLVLDCVTVSPCFGLLCEWMAINAFEESPEQSPILKTLLASSPSPDPLVRTNETSQSLRSTRLNPMQFKAVNQVLGALEKSAQGVPHSLVTVVNGPPGTGKTQVICELTQRLQKQGVRVLVVGHSNDIAEHIFKKLMQVYPQITVAGKIKTKNDAKGSRPLLWSLDKLKSSISGLINSVHQSDADVLKTIDRLNRLKRRLNQTMPLFAVRVQMIIDELICEIKGKDLIKKEMLSNATNNIEALLPDNSTRFKVGTLAVADVMVGTLHGLSAHHKVQGVLEWCSFLEPDKSLVVILDEGSQALLSSVLPTLLLKQLKHLVIVGDSRQLSPTTHSEPAPESVLSQTLRVISPKAVISLEASYRADSAITALWSRISYQDKVHSALPVERQEKYKRLRSALAERVSYLQPHPVTFIDVIGRQRKKQTSYSNAQEARLVLKLLSDLLRGIWQVEQENPFLSDLKVIVLVIAGYRAQVTGIVELLQETEDASLRHFSDKVKVTTVDGAQGQEGLYTIFCTTRACVPEQEKESSIGHLASSRRLNVALSRAQCGLFILGHWAYLRKVADGPVVEMVDDLAKLADHREGLFIERSAESTDEEKKGAELNCLARGYHKKEVWCRLKAAPENKGLQVAVLSKEGGPPVERWEVSDVTLSQIHQENTQSLSTLKARLLNLLSTSPNAYLTSVVNWAMLLDFFEKQPCESFVTISSENVMRNSL